MKISSIMCFLSLIIPFLLKLNRLHSFPAVIVNMTLIIKICLLQTNRIFKMNTINVNRAHFSFQKK